MKKMKYIISAWILTLIFPLSAYCGETVTGSDTEKKPATEKAIKQEQKKSFQKKDMKKDVPEMKPNIAEEYKPLIAEYDKYWKFVRENNLDGAYGMESEEYKKVVTIREYKGLQEMTQMPVTIKAVRALEVQKKDEKEVIVRGTMRLQSGLLDTVRVFYDRWVKAGDEWRHLREIKEYDTEKKKNS
jgi:hypothetical protein